MPDEAQMGWLQKLVSGAGSIKLANGLVGKMTQIAIIANIALASVACFAKSDTIQWGCIAIILTLTYYIVRNTLAFAAAHPEAALLEGAEFTHHQKTIMQMIMKTDGKYSLLPISLNDVTSPPSPIADATAGDAK